jgi:hypothetical protein
MLLTKITRKWFVITAVLIALMVLSSPTALVYFTFIAFYFIYLLFWTKKYSNLFVIALAFISGLLLSSYYWLSVLMESRFTQQALTKNLHILYQPISDLLFRSYKFGLLFQGPNGELYFIVGFIQWILIGAAVLLLIKNKFNKKDKPLLILFLIAFIATVFFVTPYSQFIWDYFSLYKSLQFSFRLLILLSFLAAIIAGFVVKKINNSKLFYLICFLAIFSTIVNWGNRKMIPEQTDVAILKILPFAPALEEAGGDPAVPIWSVKSNTYWKKNIPNSHLEVLTGNAVVKEIKRNSTQHEYIVSVTGDTLFKENTLYFPNWTLRANNQIRKITYTNPRYPGVIIFSLPKGLYKVDLSFDNSQVRTIGQSLSICALAAIIFLGLFPVKKQRNH